jgi:cytochrome c biogenesis protein CcmG/thiol:disulfide interchange protein DsbE
MRTTALLLLVLMTAGCRKQEPVTSTSSAAPQTKPKPAATEKSNAYDARGSEQKPETPPATPATSEVSVGARMPPYSAKTLDGTPFDLAAEHGNVVFLNVWATWCGPCRFEIPLLETMHNKYAAQGFKVIGVSVDETGPQSVRDFVKEQKMTYPIAVDPEGKLANLLQTTVLPTSILIDRDGTIVWRHFGLLSSGDESLTKALDTALAQKRG